MSSYSSAYSSSSAGNTVVVEDNDPIFFAETNPPTGAPQPNPYRRAIPVLLFALVSAFGYSLLSASRTILRGTALSDVYAKFEKAQERKLIPKQHTQLYEVVNADPNLSNQEIFNFCKENVVKLPDDDSQFGRKVFAFRVLPDPFLRELYDKKGIEIQGAMSNTYIGHFANCLYKPLPTNFLELLISPQEINNRLVLNAYKKLTNPHEVEIVRQKMVDMQTGIAAKYLLEYIGNVHDSKGASKNPILSLCTSPLIPPIFKLAAKELEERVLEAQAEANGGSLTKILGYVKHKILEMKINRKIDALYESFAAFSESVEKANDGSKGADLEKVKDIAQQIMFLQTKLIIARSVRLVCLDAERDASTLISRANKLLGYPQALSEAKFVQEGFVDLSTMSKYSQSENEELYSRAKYEAGYIQ